MLALFTALALAATSNAGALAWQDYTYTTHERPPQTVSGQSARLLVAENPAKPAGASVDLWVMRLPSTSAHPGVPTVYLHGGPGGSSAEHLDLPEFRALFDSLRVISDVVMFDQRGCGRSTPSMIPSDAPRPERGTLASRASFLAYIARLSRLVQEKLVTSGHDPRQYNVPNSVEDLEALRRALGAPRITLLAHSYGTQLAQAYVRRYPASVDRLVLIGPRGMDTARKLPAAGDSFLSRIGELARADTTVSAHLPDLMTTLDRVLARLDAQPLAVELKGPDGTVTREVGGYALRFIIAKFYLNDPDNFRFLPKMLDEIDTGREPWSLRFNLGKLLGGGVSFAWFTTDAASGVSAGRDAVIREQARTSRLGDASNFPFPDINEVWGMPDLGGAYREPVESDVPTLFVAGTLDGITPVEQAKDVMERFHHGRLLTVENGGHVSQLRAPGIASAIAGFCAGDTPPAVLWLPAPRFVPLVTPPSATRP